MRVCVLRPRSRTLVVREFDSGELTVIGAGTPKSGTAVLLTGDSGEPAPTTVPDVFPPGVLLYLSSKSTALAFRAYPFSPSSLGRTPYDEADPGQIFAETFTMLGQLHEEAEEDQEMLPLQVMGLMLVDWLDPQKAVYVRMSRSSVPCCVLRESRCDADLEAIEIGMV